MTEMQLVESECEPAVDMAALPLTHELWWPAEWAALRLSRVYGAKGLPGGNGHPVIAIPGFLGSFAGLRPLTGWLERVGFDVHDPGFERNVQCPDVLLERLSDRVASIAASQGKVTLIGHSLGGSLARAAAVRAPGLVDVVITMASPLRSVRAHPLVADLARLLALVVPARHGGSAQHMHAPTCACELAELLASPIPVGVRRVAIYTRDDGIVDWRTCMEGDDSVDVEVSGTHVGLVVNRSAYEAIAQALTPTTGR